ncbi:MAG TPA: ATP-binding protein [Blastocatellia bacterium]|nr:ATP-binding protein [Blastocatellia bacterium]
MSWSIFKVTIRDEYDVVAARQRARQIAGLLGFDLPDQTRIATAVSEVARLAYLYAGVSHVEFWIEAGLRPQILLVYITQEVPGDGTLADLLRTGRRTGGEVAEGLAGARRLIDRLEYETGPGQPVRILLKKALPAKVHPTTEEELNGISNLLVAQPVQSPLAELRQQNQELVRVLDELRRRQDELGQLGRELEDTNRGVAALYAELDEKAHHLRRADEAKTRFLSNMSHEFRTPVSSIQALTQLLLKRADGELSTEQERQVSLIGKAAQGLNEMVNDLLDIAGIEAGRTVVRIAEFEVGTLFSALRGMLRPLLLNQAVKLIFDEPEGMPPLNTDEGKVSQILRNLIANALKFTEQGEVRVSAAVAADGRSIVFAVADTGVGIAEEDQIRIFDEFEQVENRLQMRVKGTGLGLPLCRWLAKSLGGTVSVSSHPGMGATFRAVIPISYPELNRDSETAGAAIRRDLQHR